MKNEFIFLGAPASGKGTQTKKLAEDLGIPHIDTGGMLRAAVAEGTDFGKIAKSFMDQGKLVPVNIVAGIINDRLHKPDCSKGFILDGYPRSIEQAEILEKILDEINNGEDAKVHVINIDTGCVYNDPGYGTLTAIELNSGELFFV
jgi:adenylate kinase